MSNARLNRKYRTAPWYKYDEYSGLCSVDLGKRKVGVALFCDIGVLRAAKTIHTQADTSSWDPIITADAVFDYVDKEPSLDPDIPVDWVCEWPAPRKNDRARHHNITALQAVGDELEVRHPVTWAEKYKPFEWKRNVDKVLHHSRIAEALSPGELFIWSKLGHDARDAVGIGLFALGRVDYIGRAI